MCSPEVMAGQRVSWRVAAGVSWCRVKAGVGPSMGMGLLQTLGKSLVTKRSCSRR